MSGQYGFQQAIFDLLAKKMQIVWLPNIKEVNFFGHTFYLKNQI